MDWLRRPRHIFALLVAAVGAIHLALALAVPAPIVFPDELIYLELARHVAQGHGLAFRGVPSNLPTVLFPLLMAPFQLLAPEAAYKAIQAANAILLTLTAVPLYAIARRFLSAPAAIAAALLPLLAPYTLYADLAMTESLFLLLIACVAEAMLRAADEPGKRWKVVLGLLLGASLFTKPQGALLALVVAGAIALAEPGGLRARVAAVLRFWPVALGLGAAVALFVARMAVLAGSLSPSALIGFYAKDTVGGPAFTLGHFAEAVAAIAGAVAMSVGFLPMALFVPFAWRAFRGGSNDERRLAAFVPLLAAMLWVVAARLVATTTPGYIHERYGFYVAPFLVIGALVAARRGVSARAAVGAAGLVGLGALFARGSVPSFVDAPTYAALFRPMQTLGPTGAAVAVAVGGLALVLALAWLLARRRWALAGALFGAYLVGLTGFSFHAQRTLSGIYAGQRPFVAWVQAHAAPDRPIAWVSDGLPYMAMMQLDAFAAQPIRAIYLDEPFAPYLEQRATVAPDGAIAELSALPDGARVLSSARVPLALPVIATRDGVTIYLKRGPVRTAPDSSEGSDRPKR